MRLVRYGSRDSDGMVWWWGRQDQSNLMGRRVVYLNESGDGV
jgi:hypothetical protein